MVATLVYDQETPPRAWGRPALTALSGGNVGNTPTGVGKTQPAIKPPMRTRKHPHGRGEDTISGYAKRARRETPPRAWGRLSDFQRAGQAARNTPTGVGKTHLVARSVRCTRKHPHGRGEDLPHLAERWRWLETPPRAWGRRSGSGDDDLSGGNTPTGVGKTGFRAHSGYLCEKHPHGRGEDRPSNDACQWCRETPPRAWGRLTANQVSVPIGGNTPTGVGKTFAVAGVPAPRRKHPHGRGEDCRLRAYRCPLLETPPRAWGRRPSVSAHETLHGNTPSGVGKTPWRTPCHRL